MKKRRLALIFGASLYCLAAASAQADGQAATEMTGEAAQETIGTEGAETEYTVTATEQTVITENTIGEEDGYGYELWKDEGDTSMTLTGDGTFTCEWDNINSALFRRGQKFDCTKTWQELGDISVDYEVDYEPIGNSYLCLYGWTREPLIEYYIVDSWGSWRPPGAASIGTITVDGDEYDVYRTLREEQPSIDGTATFEQYWSVRKEKRTEGTIDASAHFGAWESLGMPMGKFYEASLTVEGYQSSGKAVVLKNELKIEGGGNESTEESDPEALSEEKAEK